MGRGGRDTLDGRLGENILIGGTTAYDAATAANNAAWAAIISEWTSKRKIGDRIARLQAGVGTNHSISLKLGTTVFDDGLVDSLLGNSSSNWFLA